MKAKFLLLSILTFGLINLSEAQTLIDCPNPLDIHIANDISGSVSSLEHQQSKEFITQLGLSLPLGTGANESRVGISQWSAGSGRFVEYAFPGAGATFTTSQADIVSYVNSSRPFRGGTDVYTALIRAYDWVKQDRAGIRTGTPIIVLLTDSSCGQIARNVSSLATQIKSEGILIQVLAIDNAVSCTALQGTNVASPGGYFAAADYATLQSDALFYITNLLANSCPAPPEPSVADLTVNLSGFEITGCDTTPVADVDYTVTNVGEGNFSGTLDVSFYNGDPTLPGTQYLFTESSSQTLTASGGSTSTLNSTNSTLLDTGELYAVVNIDGSLPANAVPLSANFTGVSLTDTTEENTANNISNAVARADAGTCVPYAIIQTSVTNSGQICDNEAIYYVEVCNIGTADAHLGDIVPYPPAEFNLVNGPVLVGNDPFVGTSLPLGECVIYEYTYNLDNAVASTSYDFSVSIEEITVASSNCRDTTTTVVDVTTAGFTWMDRNLGASRVATSETDAAGFGDLYQWGRCAEGHQLRNSSTTTTLATTAEPNDNNSWDGKFIILPSPSGFVFDWLAVQDDNLWQGVSGTNNPCPSGYRIPAISEFQALINSAPPFGPTEAMSSPIKMPIAGSRIYLDGTLVGTNGGTYWTSNTALIYSNALQFGQTTSTAFVVTDRAMGESVRCIKD